MHTTPLILSALAALAQGAALVTREDITQCLAASGVPYDTKGSSDWNTDATSFNIRLPYTPVAIAVPRTVDHIKKAVLCGKKLKTKVSPRSGGHSYASFGLGGDNAHLVIELSRMYGVSFDKPSGVATVEPGARLGHMASVLYNQYGVSVSHGTCPG